MSLTPRQGSLTHLGGKKKVSTYVLLSIHIFCTTRINPLPDDKTLDWSKLKAFAEDKIKVNEKF